MTALHVRFRSGAAPMRRDTISPFSSEKFTSLVGRVRQ